MGEGRMSYKSLTEDEQVALEIILEDLHYLFDKEEIDVNEMSAVLNNLKSEEIHAYINSLFSASKPERALREAFFSLGGILYT
ncbi:MAG TPA: hypothetical protein ENF47_03445, partial [Thermoprotei archaeon]|nr:hypothetical protein [Thermoprotei archaeon]